MLCCRAAGSGRKPGLLRAALEGLVRDALWAGPEEVRYAVRSFVWARWLGSAAFIALLVYRPAEFPGSTYLTFYALVTVLVGSNVLLHWRVLSPRPMGSRWMLGTNLGDAGLVTFAVLSTGGFSHYFQFLLYYPVLAMFAVVVPSARISMAWVTLVAAIYAAVCLLVGNGLDLEARDDKTLFARIVVMYMVSLVVNMVSGVERNKRMQAVERERTLVRERLEVSQALHDTAAQTAYMAGMGIDNARALAEGAGDELKSSLAAASELSRSVMWELRHPVDAGPIFEGLGLGSALRSHVETFRRITSVPALMQQSGDEPPLELEVRTRLFAFAHNALTNAFRHAHAGRVEVSLDFTGGSVRLSVRDDGVGLPKDYDRRGRGFPNMRRDAERLGGVMTVETGPGTAVTWIIPTEGG